MKEIEKYMNKGGVQSRLLMAMLCISSMLFVSCDDTLNTAPSDRFTEDAVWEDEALIEAYIGNTYRTLPSGLRYSLYGLSIVVDENNARGNSWAWSVWAGNLTPDDLREVDYWTGDASRNITYWQPINRVNLFFQNIERPRENEIDSDIKNRMIGEMKVIRAHSYFKLISLFGGVPLITKTFSLDDDFKVLRNSYDECMEFVLSELDEAIDLLPLDYDNANQGRVTKGAAMAIKARALLYNASPLNNPSNDLQKWQLAADAAKEIIDLNKYELFDDYRTMFLEENIYNTEMIWQRPYNQYESPEAVYVELSLYPNGYNGFGQVHPLQNLVDDYETANGLLPEDDPEYDPQNPYVNRDPRFYATILHDGAPFQGREVETFYPGGLDSNEGPVSAWNATETGYYQLKFANERIVNPSGNNMSQTPWTHYRYAEVLLNYAEANYFLGNEEVTREYLNRVRKRPSVNMPEITDSGESLFQKIVNERRIELVFEEHRWFDIRRWEILPEVANEDLKRIIIRKQPDGTKTYEVAFWKEGKYNEANYLLPIPQIEINKNGLLEQNPGYN